MGPSAIPAGPWSARLLPAPPTPILVVYSRSSYYLPLLPLPIAFFDPFPPSRVLQRGNIPPSPPLQRPGSLHPTNLASTTIHQESIHPPFCKFWDNCQCVCRSICNFPCGFCFWTRSGCFVAENFLFFNRCGNFSVHCRFFSWSPSL